MRDRIRRSGAGAPRRRDVCRELQYPDPLAAGHQTRGYQPDSIVPIRVPDYTMTQQQRPSRCRSLTGRSQPGFPFSHWVRSIPA